jgi:RNA polymerase sigma-70 factor (ECF subfamily)
MVIASDARPGRRISGQDDGNTGAAPEREDSHLLGRCARDRDQTAFGELYRRYEAPIYSLCLRLTRNRALAEDALQEAFWDVWRGAGTFQGEREARQWILRLAARQAAKLAAAARCASQRDRAAVSLAGAWVAEEDSERASLMRYALAELSAPQRELLELYYAEWLSQGEIGRRLGLPQRTVSYRLGKVLAALRKIMMVTRPV